MWSGLVPVRPRCAAAAVIILTVGPSTSKWTVVLKVTWNVVDTFKKYFLAREEGKYTRYWLSVLIISILF